MSGWAIVTRTLGDLGGGPVKADDMLRDYTGDGRTAVQRARKLGLICHAGNRYLWELTPLGRDWYSGRVKALGGGYTGPIRFVSTIASVGDGWIERLLLDAGHQPGTAITPAVLRAYSTELVRMARAAA